MKLLPILIASTAVFSKPVQVGEKRLISLSPGHQEWMNEKQILALHEKQTRFIDLTEGDFQKLTEFGSTHSSFAPTQFLSLAVHQDEVKKYISLIKQDGMVSFLTTFAGYKNRYYKSTFGAQSCVWLFDQISAIATSTPRTDAKLTVTKFTHSWGQFSVVAKLEPIENAKPGVVVIGAHQDSINGRDPMNGVAPGADDDASGTTTIYEALRTLWTGGFVPQRPVHFHWYSGEEAGLLGSQKLAADYVAQKTEVYAMLQNDMTGYKPKNKPSTIGVVTDFVNPELTKSLKVIIDAYGGVPWVDTTCGYGCSDHASWTEAKIPAAFAFETKFGDHSPYIHKATDTVDTVDFVHMQAFVRNSIGFAVEMSLYNE